MTILSPCHCLRIHYTQILHLDTVAEGRWFHPVLHLHMLHYCLTLEASSVAKHLLLLVVDHTTWRTTVPFPGEKEGAKVAMIHPVDRTEL